MSGTTPSSTKETSSGASPPSRGRTWFQALADGAQPVDAGLGSVLVTDATWRASACDCSRSCRIRRIAFLEPGTASSELEEGWALAHHVREAIAADSSGTKRPIVAIVDVQSQAYGRLEALLGIHLSLAAAADAYATARMAGHPIVALIVGTALSGGPPGAWRPGPSAARTGCSRGRRPCDAQALGRACHAADGRRTRRARQDRHSDVV